MMHHHHHYTSQAHHRPPPAPPPPPPPPEAFETVQDNTGRPRCYYCGKSIAREADVRKTDHHLGHGYTTLVMICPECRGKKERGEGPWTGAANRKVGGVVLLCAGILLAILGYLSEQAWEKRQEKQTEEWMAGTRKLKDVENGPPAGFFMIGGGLFAVVGGLGLIFSAPKVTVA